MIEVKWFNKITRWFKAEDEYEIEEIIVEDNEHIDIDSLREKGIKVTTEENSRFIKNRELELERRKNAVIHGEIDAKISYQYPKGNFRFPVIPDYEPRERRKAKGSTESAIRPKYSVVKTVHAKTKYSSPLPIQEEERKKRPFSPTQIPSPVYGFQKRPNTIEEEREQKLPKRSAVEATHDIPAVLRKGNENLKKEQVIEEHVVFNRERVDSTKDQDKNEKTSYPSETTNKMVVLPIQTKKSMNEEAVSSIHEVKKEEVETETTAVVNHVTSIEQTNLEVCSCNESENVAEQLMEATDIIKEKVHEDIGQGQPSNLGEQALHIENHLVRAETTASIESISVEVEAEEGKVDIANFESENGEEVEQINSAPLSTVQEESYQQNINSTGEEHKEELISSPALAHSHEEVAPALEVEEVEASPSSPLTAEKAPKRKPIPFNVVMLRQDRLKMQNNQQHVEKKTEKIMERTNEVHPNVRIEPTAVEAKGPSEELPYYHFPSIDLLSPPVSSENDDEWLDQQGYMLNETLLNFNVKAKVVNITQGPAVTQFEVQPDPGVKVNKITNLTDDIKLCLAAQDIRMEAPIPGKHTIGIEIPNRKSRAVPLREILESSTFTDSESPLTVALGLDITGAPVVTDLRKMPHGLIAGATGSGKSVCINTMLVSLLYKATPQDVKLLLIDPKVVELAPYNNIPHLVSPVITDVKAATAALKWAVEEMDKRYELFSHTGVRDLQRFNKKAEEAGEYAKKLPYIVIIIDELADLMMMSPAEVEESICRIAQKARACGIHLVLATQRPSVDVITGLIKANIPTRIAFSVSSQVDSRTIIDTNGADKLLGRGDMLFLENGSSKTVRLQGTFVSDEEIEDVVDFVKKEQEPQYLFMQEDLLSKAQIFDERDELFLEACEFVVYQNAASTSSLQRRFHIGYNRAARLMDMLESKGIISEARGSKPRDVLMTELEMQEWLQAENE